MEIAYFMLTTGLMVTIAERRYKMGIFATLGFVMGHFLWLYTIK